MFVLKIFTEDGNGDVISRNRPEATEADIQLGFRNHAYDSNEVDFKYLPIKNIVISWY